MFKTTLNKRIRTECLIATPDSLNSIGITNFLDVLDAERNLQQTELALADSAAAVSIDLVALYKALGGGWEVQFVTYAIGP
jgi:hypothetical protein